jgi:hypothetical protein
MAERLFNIGYVAAAAETTPGTAVTPTDYFQAYESGLTTSRNFEELEPAAGNVYSTQNVVAGQRDHMGDMTLIFEPNTAEKLFNMMLAVGSKTGSNPYTSTGTLSASAPKSYTIDISSGNIVHRYMGCQVSKLAPDFNGNEVRIKPTLSALGSFHGREISTITGSSPYLITLKTDYDPAPATGVVVGDVMRMYIAAGTTVDFAVTAVTATTISTTTNVATGAAGDFVYLRPATPSFSMLPPALWSNTQFCFGATASAALSASQTRVDSGSTWELTYDFKDNKGEHRSGSEDPATLLRKPAKVVLTIKKYFDTPLDVIAFNNLAKSACVVRHYVYSGGKTYEVRITFNNLTTNDPLPKFKAGEINYSEIKYIAKQDTSDGQAFSVTVLNANSSLT